MQRASIEHLETVVNMLGNLRLRETRMLFSTLRECGASADGKDDVALANGLMPRFGVTVGEIGFAYIINQPSRNKS